jgi:flavodoxin
MKRCLKILALTTLLGLFGLAPNLAIGQAALNQTTAGKPSVGPFGRALVIYFSGTGKTEKVAAEIKASVNGDLLRLETEEVLPKDERAIIDQVKPYRQTGGVMKVKPAAPNIANYDVVFIGGPVWFGEPAFPLATFLKDMDFKGKKVVPFGTSGSNYGKAFDTLVDSLKNAAVVPGGKIFDRQTLESDDLRKLVAAWLATIAPAPKP